MKPSCPLTISPRTKLDPDMRAWCEEHRDLRVCGDCVVVRGDHFRDAKEKVEEKVEEKVKGKQGRLW